MGSRFRLANGLTVVYEPVHAAPVAAFQIWVKVGSADEQPHEEGLAHLHEHMLFKGTERRGLGEIARSVEAAGGEINAWTSFDQTVYHVVMARRHARAGLDVLADAVRFSSFDAGELSREIEVVCEEIKRSLDSPSRRASKDLFATLFKVHPYGRPVIGSEASVRAHTRDKVVAFYRRYYTPQNMVLAAAGDFTEAELHAWAEELLGGDWGRPFAAPPARTVEPALSGIRTLLKEDAVQESWLNVAFPIPGSSHPDAPALDVLAMITGQGDSSRLSLEVKRRRELVNDVHAFAYTPKDAGMFAVTMTVAKGDPWEAMLASTQVLVQLQQHPVDEDELATVKALIESDAIYQRESMPGLARKLGSYETDTGIEREAVYYEQIAQVTPAQLQEAARRYLKWDNAAITGLLPAGVTFTEAQAREILKRTAHAQTTAFVSDHRGDAFPTTALRIRPAGSARPSVTRVEKLPSGATVVVREEHHVPLFAMRAAFLGGLRYETANDNGLTALLSRMMVRGTQTLNAEAVSHRVDRLAGSLSSVAGRNSISVRGEFLSKHFDPSFALVREVMNAPAFAEQEVKREREQLLQDVLTREDKPSAVAFELFADALYSLHPWRLPATGKKESVVRLNRQMLVEHHQRYMDPSQLVLSVVGDVDTDHVLALASEAFGKSRGGAVAAPTIAVEPGWKGRRERKRVLAKAQSHLVLGFPGAKITDDWRRPLEVMSTLLSGQSGRLFMELRDKRSLAYSVSAMTAEGVDPGYFAVYIGTSPEKLTQALEGIEAELSKLREAKVRDEELDRAKEYLIGSHEIGLQRNGARAAVMALDELYGLGAEHYQTYAQEIAAVTHEDILRVAQRVINFEQSALATVGP
jgi:zinc protease